MKKNVIRLNESQLHNLINESVKRVIKEWGELDDRNWFLNHERTPNIPSDDDYEESHNPEEEAQEVFQRIEEGDGIDANNAEVEVVDKKSGLVKVHITEDGWQFWFSAVGKRVDEHDLFCTITERMPRPWPQKEDIEYTSPDGDEGYWHVSGTYLILIKNWF